VYRIATTKKAQPTTSITASSMIVLQIQRRYRSDEPVRHFKQPPQAATGALAPISPQKIACRK
jgi:hypothetical protein